jgi:hypothetical protein
MNELLDDYKRRLISINEMIELEEKAGDNTSNLMALVRMKTKKGCYNTVITELERLKKRSASEEDTGWVIFDNTIGKYFGKNAQFTTKLKSATVFEDRLYAESVLIMYSRKASEDYIAGTIEILPIVIKLKERKP